MFATDICETCNQKIRIKKPKLFTRCQYILQMGPDRGHVCNKPIRNSAANHVYCYNHRRNNLKKQDLMSSTVVPLTKTVYVNNKNYESVDDMMNKIIEPNSL